ncbi:MAG: hypothetical protein ACOCP4_03940 [Candidatus Woesearchaeota archaeon]
MIFDKKAGIMDAQFGWVFAFMIGVLILSLFTVVGFQIRGTSEQKISFELVKTFRSIFISGGTEVGRFFQLDLVNVMMDYECVGDGETSITSGDVTETIPLVLFSQNDLIGNRFYIYSNEWNVPFLSESVLYLASENFIFYLFEPDSSNEVEFQTYRNVLESVPSRFPFKIVRRGDDINVPEESESKVIFFENFDENLLENFSREPDVILEVSPNVDSNGFYGNISYYTDDSDNSDEESYYFGIPMLFGSFLSSYEDHTCFFNRMVRNLENVLDLLYRRSVKLRSYYESIDDSNCRVVYGSINDGLGDYSDFVKGFNYDNYDYDDMKVWYGNYKNIAKLKNRADNEGCEVIY